MGHTRPQLKGHYTDEPNPISRQLTAQQLLQHISWELEDGPHRIMMQCCEQLHRRAMGKFLDTEQDITQQSNNINQPNDNYYGW